ncbi:MAG: hypothetical protein ACI9KE_002199 [Polyangiales bacterium]|jgi:hypothetical protein
MRKPLSMIWAVALLGCPSTPVSEVDADPTGDTGTDTPGADSAVEDTGAVDAAGGVPDAAGEDTSASDTGAMDAHVDVGPPPRDVDFEGFGAGSRGGQGGRVFTVTNLDDSGEGSLRWAVERDVPRIVEFDVDGVIRLRSALQIHDPFITIDGRGALDPGEAGITIRDYPIDIRTNDVVVTYLRVRLGDWAVLKRVSDSGRSRPQNSNDLDCINIHQSNRVMLDHLSMSWSADEIVSVTNSQNITVQWSILSEPIGDPRVHPYGDNHAYAANNSASTLTYHHNLFAHYRFRGPQFEANDMQDNPRPFDANFEAINNVIYAYTSSGSRYRSGFERDRDRTREVDFNYHFVGNQYLNSRSGISEIQVDDRYGVEPNIHVFFDGNIGPHRSASEREDAVAFTDTGARDPIRSEGARSQISDRPLFEVPVPVTVQSADVAAAAVLAGAGCSIERDDIDARIVDDARRVRPTNTISSQEDVPGGWPSYP